MSPKKYYIIQNIFFPFKGDKSSVNILENQRANEASRKAKTPAFEQFALPVHGADNYRTNRNGMKSVDKHFQRPVEINRRSFRGTFSVW